MAKPVVAGAPTVPRHRYSLAALYLAFRHAKTSLYYERRGVGLLDLARFESNLDARLRALQATLDGNGGWFDGIPIGEVWITPKRLAGGNEPSVEGIIRIGVPAAAPPDLDVQLRLSPSPQFAIVEVLFLWRFGVALESVLSSNAIGYRLDQRNGVLRKDGRWLFQYWPTQYKQFRTAPIEAARDAIADDGETTILSVDLASFYDTVDPAFLVAADFVGDVTRCASARGHDFQRDDYVRAANSLLGAHAEYWALASKRTGLPWKIGLPIGPLTSRVVANVALATLDRKIEAAPSTKCYRRYVDDIVVVCRTKTDQFADAGKLVEAVFPMRSVQDNELVLDTAALGRSGSGFRIQRQKLRAHHLVGLPGQHFLKAVNEDFNKLVSERRAFLDDSTILEEAAKHLTRAGKADGSPLRVLRDADRVRLEHFALSTSLESLERVSVLVDKAEARELARRTQERIERVLAAEDDWVTNLDLSLRLLQLAIVTDDLPSFRTLMKRMDAAWSSTTKLAAQVRRLRHMGRELPKASGWAWLRNYLHERRNEAISKSIGEDCPRILSHLRRRAVIHRGGLRSSTTFLEQARKLSVADLRARDREEDHPAVSPGRSPSDVRLTASLSRNAELGERLTTIGEFVKLCRKLSDPAWAIEAWRLFLCVRPPSYLDVARRLLAEVESKGFRPDAFEEILKVVNAVRGTRYTDPVGTVADAQTVRLGPSVLPFSPVTALVDPRIILGNFVTTVADWEGAATWVAKSPFGSPKLTVARLRDLVVVLKRARAAARVRNAARVRPPSLLVLPELSVPRRWFRMLANHIARVPGLALVMGMEYRHNPRRREVLNQVFTVIPGGLGAAVTWSWTKRRPAREEEALLLGRALTFPPFPARARRRTVVSSVYGNFSVLICSELIEARRVADLLGRVDVLFVPSWNPDTASYDHLVQSVSFQLHAITAVANNGHYSDCRAWAPLSERWKRDLCRLIQRDINDVVSVEIPLRELRKFHARIIDPVRDEPKGGAIWFPLPPDWP